VNSAGPDNTALEIHTRDQAEAAGAQIATLTIQINAAVAMQNRAEFAAQKHGKAAQDLRERIARYETALRSWAEQNRALMGDKKSLELRHVEIAFKMSPPAVTLLEKWELKDVIKKLWRSRKLKQYVRVKHELDRQRILADVRPEVGRLTMKLLKRFGLVVSKEEKFYVDPKLAPTT